MVEDCCECESEQLFVPRYDPDSASVLTGFPVFSQGPFSLRAASSSNLLTAKSLSTSFLKTRLSLASIGGPILYHHGRNHCNSKLRLPTHHCLLPAITAPYRPHTTMITPSSTRRSYSPLLNCLLTRRAMLTVPIPPPTPLISMHSLSTPLCH